MLQIGGRIRDSFAKSVCRLTQLFPVVINADEIAKQHDKTAD